MCSYSVKHTHMRCSAELSRVTQKFDTMSKAPLETVFLPIFVNKTEHIREYIRDFFMYGFSVRGFYDRRCAVRYKAEEHRSGAWIYNIMHFGYNCDGHRMLVCGDTRLSMYNPLERTWRSHPVSANGITLHFMLLDILACARRPIPLSEISAELDERLTDFDEPMLFDDVMLRKKLKQYADMGLISIQRLGSRLYYRRRRDTFIPQDAKCALDFFSSVLPCGVLGSFISSRLCGDNTDYFAYYGRHLTHVLDDGILAELFDAMGNGTAVSFGYAKRRSDTDIRHEVVPLRILAGEGDGLRYLLAYLPDRKCMQSFRVDLIFDVSPGAVFPDVHALRSDADALCANMWGGEYCGDEMAHVEFKIRGDEESARRLVSERRCGCAECRGDSAHFSADITDVHEILPWIMTFTGYITELDISSSESCERLEAELCEMYRMYEID